jgi:D-alanyl-D-alanine carboxypeptidase
MARIGPILLAALALLVPHAAVGAWSERNAAQIDALVAKFMQPRPGKVTPTALSIAVGIDGALVLAKGFGAARIGVPADGRTVYHIGSLTKQFTAAAVLKLIETGMRTPIGGKPLTLDTPLRDIFDGVERWAAADEPPVLLHSLLTMTSNLPNFTKHPPPEEDPWGAVEAERLFAALKRQAPHGWPNTFEYSNTGYFVLAHAIAAVLAANGAAQASTRDYVRAALLRPAGLIHTGFVGEKPTGSELATPHYHRRPAFQQPHWLDGCGDMASSAIDIFAWNKALMEGRVLSASSRAAMFSDAARVDPLTYYGMGWFVGHDGSADSYHHSGSVPGFTSYNAIVRRRDGGRWISVTLLTNSDGVEGLEQLADDILSGIGDLP